MNSNKQNKFATIDRIINATTSFHNQLMNEENGRFRSWEHCYLQFSYARKKETPDYDYLSLHLAFYLASWGMYRGSSFLLQKDYKIHISVVKEILKKKYDVLDGIESQQYYVENTMILLMDLAKKITEYYKPIWKTVKEAESNKFSDTLVTKILMGTLACVPAYDRYFVAGVRNQGIASGGFTPRSLLGFWN